MPNGISALYNTIKAQEAYFPIPPAAVTVKVGTFDAATGQFTYAAGWDTDESEGDGGSVDKPTPNCLSFVVNPNPRRRGRKRPWRCLPSTAWPHWNCGVCCRGVGPPLTGAISVRGSLISVRRWTADDR